MDRRCATSPAGQPRRARPAAPPAAARTPLHGPTRQTAAGDLGRRHVLGARTTTNSKTGTLSGVTAAAALSSGMTCVPSGLHDHGSDQFVPRVAMNDRSPVTSVAACARIGTLGVSERVTAPLIQGSGLPLTAVVTAANVADVAVFEARRRTVVRAEPTPPPSRPGGWVPDRRAGRRLRERRVGGHLLGPNPTGTVTFSSIPVVSVSQRVGSGSGRWRAAVVAAELENGA